MEALKKQGAGDILVVCGGVIPPQDYDFLYKVTEGVWESCDSTNKQHPGAMAAVWFVFGMAVADTTDPLSIQTQPSSTQAGACAIFGPGTRITSAAKDVLDRIKEKRGYK